MSQGSPLLRLLQDRVSIPARLLSEPGPSLDQICEAVRAAVTAPDHASLKPWHFVVVSGATRTKLAELFCNALRRRNPDASSEEIEYESKKAYRAPTIVVVYIKIDRDNPKVPIIEQIASGGAAAENLLLAFDAMGFGSIILTGANARDLNVKRALGLSQEDEIIGLIYAGTPPEKKPKKRRLTGDDFEGHLTIWTG
jgi:nitroreductase